MTKQALYTESTTTGKRSFFFDIKETKNGEHYMAINSVTFQEDTPNDRKQLIIFENEMDHFAGAFMRSLLNFEAKASK